MAAKNPDLHGPVPDKRLHRIFDHIDLRVPTLAKVRPFYAALLPALGFTKDVSDEKWFNLKRRNGRALMSFSESPNHRAMFRTKRALHFGRRARRKLIDWQK